MKVLITILVACIAIAICDPIKEEVASVAASQDEQPADTQTQSLDDSDDMERSETIFAKKLFLAALLKKKFALGAGVGLLGAGLLGGGGGGGGGGYGPSYGYSGPASGGYGYSGPAPRVEVRYEGPSAFNNGYGGSNEGYSSGYGGGYSGGYGGSNGGYGGGYNRGYNGGNKGGYIIFGLNGNGGGESYNSARYSAPQPQPQYVQEPVRVNYERPRYVQAQAPVQYQPIQVQAPIQYQQVQAPAPVQYQQVQAPAPAPVQYQQVQQPQPVQIQAEIQAPAPVQIPLRVNVIPTYVNTGSSYNGNAGYNTNSIGLGENTRGSSYGQPQVQLQQVRPAQNTFTTGFVSAGISNGYNYDVPNNVDVNNGNINSQALTSVHVPCPDNDNDT